MKLFADKIVQLRATRGFTTRQVASAIRIGEADYKKIERGEIIPRRYVAVRIARFLGGDEQELLALWLVDDAMGRIARDPLRERAADIIRRQLDPTAPTLLRSESGELNSEHVSSGIVANLHPHSLPCYLQGDARKMMSQIEDESIDCIITTPPYWRRRYQGTESLEALADTTAYLQMLGEVTSQCMRVLKPTGSLWLNLGDATEDDVLQCLPWRTALAMIDNQGWRLANDVIWDKAVSSPQGANAHLRKVHEYLFHFVKNANYYFDDEQLREEAHAVFRVENEDLRSGHVATVKSTRYIRRIEACDALTPDEKAKAKTATRRAVRAVAKGEMDDFRLFLRSQSSETGINNSSLQTPGSSLIIDDSTDKAQAIRECGFFIQPVRRGGVVPGDVWDIATPRTPLLHYTVAPDRLYRLPIVATCPEQGVVLDPFCGTGTACVIAYELNRRSIGIDINKNYLERARSRSKPKPLSLF